MQRVLSFQMARGFGESSEFVSKRMCFSFLFSVGFLCLLCGFLTGRFAAGRAVDMRAEKARLQLAGNGLENEEHLRDLLLRRIHQSNFTTDYSTGDHQRDGKIAPSIKSTLEEMQLFQRVVENRSCIVATIRGSREPDRYVVFSTFGKGVTILVELSRALKFVKDDFDWNPRRSLIFVISLESREACRTLIEHRVRFGVVSYIELDAQSISANGHFVTSGSDIAQSSILHASAGVENPTRKNELGEGPTTAGACRKMVCAGLVPRLRLDVPNALVKFLSAENSSSILDNGTNTMNAYRRGIGQVIATSVWRLSEMTILEWDPREESNVLINILQSLNSSVVPKKTIETIVAEVEAMTRYIGIFNENIDRTERRKCLDVRMANDLSMQARRLLLCNDQDLGSRSDGLALKKLKDDPSNSTRYYLDALLECYKTVNQLLQENVAR